MAAAVLRFYVTTVHHRKKKKSGPVLELFLFSRAKGGFINGSFRLLRGGRPYFE